MTLREQFAKAMYESNRFVRPWDHPRTKEMWHPIYFRYADEVLKMIRKNRAPKVRTSHHRNKEEAARLQTLVDKRFAQDGASPISRPPSNTPEK
jgi:hypothetical protein